MSLREWTTKSNFSDNSPTSRSFVNRPGLAAASTTSGLLWSASPCDVDVSTTNSTSGCAACRHRTSHHAGRATGKGTYATHATPKNCSHCQQRLHVVGLVQCQFTGTGPDDDAAAVCRGEGRGA